jgi:hypothetical protein
MTEPDFIIVGRAYQIAANREINLAEYRFRTRLVELGSQGKLSARGYKLRGGQLPSPLVQEPIEQSEWIKAKLYNAPFVPCVDFQPGWTLRNEQNTWNDVEVSTRDILTEWAGERKSVKRPAKYSTVPRAVAKKLLTEVFPQGVPAETEMNNASLLRKITKSRAFAELPQNERPGDDTILRAAARKKQAN